MESDGAIEFFTSRNVPWEKLENTQQELIQQVRDNPKNRFLLLSEPHPTFTYGRNAQKSDLLWQPQQLRAKGIEVASVSRGGKWTYHGPGQVLIYPIGSLEGWGFSSKQVKPFVELFRKCMAEAILKLGLSVRSQDEPYGLYVQNKKLASFGLSFENGISSHGAALYVTPQKEFTGIVPCGFQETQYTCLTDHLPEAGWLSAAHEVVDAFKKGFKLI